MTRRTSDAAPVSLPGTDTEFAFELRCCRWTERHWPPGRSIDDVRGALVARQLGTRRRRWDTLVVEVDVAALDRRARFGPDALDSDLLHVVRNAPTDWEWYRDALPDPGYPWRYVREAVHRAADRGIVETRTNGNRIELRRKWPYPDWIERLIAIENKPDLDASAARRLRPQIERDVALSLADEVWVATEATDDRIEPVLLEPLPVEAGLLAFDSNERSAEVVWNPRTLSVESPGTRILERPDGGEYDRSAARFGYVSPAEKREMRLRIAERAYERGWRSYAETMRPDCRHFRLRRDGDGLLPWCDAHSRCQTAAECSGSCDRFEPEPPAWRQRGWPIAGGPGKAISRLLAERRERYGPSEERSETSTSN